MTALDIAVTKESNSVIEKLKSLGMKFKKVSLPHTKYAVSGYYICVPAEVSSNLARFDGIRYGEQNQSGRAILKEVYLKTRGVGFGAEAKRRIILGTFVLSSGYYDAYYEKAQRVRTLVKRDFDEAFKAVDVMLTPVAPTPAFKIGEKANDPLAMYLCDIFTLPLKLGGFPAISIPTKAVIRTRSRRIARRLPAHRQEMARGGYPRHRPMVRKIKLKTTEHSPNTRRRR